MTLGRIFSVTGMVVAAIVVLSGLANAWLGYASNREVQRQDSAALAQGIAATIAWQVKDLEGAVQAIADQQGVIALFATGDPAKLAAESERLGKSLQGGLRVRLLKPTLVEPDKSLNPPMGYADLEMVHAAVTKNPLPMVHEFTNENRHLAIARRVVAGDRVVGVVLASISTDALTRPVAAFTNSGTIELKQGTLRLAGSGNAPPEGEPANSLPVGGSSWTIHYWLPEHSGLAILGLSTVIFFTLLFAGMTIWIAYRRMTNAFVADLDNIEMAMEASLAGKPGGNYPFQLKDFEILLEKMVLLIRGHAVKNKEPASYPDLVDNDLEEELAIPSAAFLPLSGSATDGPSRISREIFRAYDIRGIVDESLTEDAVTRIGRAIGSEARDAGQDSVVIARDGRLSSPRLSRSLAEGLRNSGCRVIDLGMVPTPVLYFATHFLDTRSGVMLTGSHNPPNYNGLKMVIDGNTLWGEGIQKLRQRIDASAFRSGNGSIENRDLIPDYVGTIIDDVQIASPLKIVVDCGNGVAGKLAPVLLRTLGCDVFELYCEVDGSFPNHHPDPGKPENLRDLITCVKARQASLGIAFDGDGDRLGVVDSSGKIIWPDRQMMLFAADVLSRKPGADIIFDVKCSRNLAKEIVKNGGKPLMWKTGHSLIKAKIKETGAPLAGEMSGHIFFKERWFGFDDGLYAAARLIEIISRDPRPSSEVFATFPDSVNTPELNVPLEEGENFRFVKKLLESGAFHDAKITDIDGLRADYPEGWGLVRASNTTPSLVIRFEAENARALRTIQEKFRTAMKRIKNDIPLPF
ncbi:MAG: phosphomannomutase/phosphoglucomutase [Gammaproteobacteria bacterium]